MRLASSLAIVAAGLFCSFPARAQLPLYYGPGAVAVGSAFRHPWPAAAVHDAFTANPLDDGYDYPFGYGEYAIYGRWAIGWTCYDLRRPARASLGVRWRTIRRCD